MNKLIKYWIYLKRKASITDLFKIIEESNRIGIINNDIKNRNILDLTVFSFIFFLLILYGKITKIIYNIKLF